MKKIFKIFIFSLMLFFSVATISISSFAWYTSLIIVYYQYEDGSEAHETYRELSPIVGETYHIDSPIIAGYKPDKEYVECVYSQTVAYWVTYYKDGYRLTINYLDENGNTLHESYNETLDKNSSYSVASPEIGNYTPDISVVSGTLTSDTEIDVIYSKTTYSLIINYIDQNNNTLANSYNNELAKNSSYEIESPAITGYTPNMNKVSGILDSNKEINVIYSLNDCILTINYLDTNNKKIKD